MGREKRWARSCGAWTQLSSSHLFNNSRLTRTICSSSFLSFLLYCLSFSLSFSFFLSLSLSISISISTHPHLVVHSPQTNDRILTLFTLSKHQQTVKENGVGRDVMDFSQLKWRVEESQNRDLSPRHMVIKVLFFSFSLSLLRYNPKVSLLTFVCCSPDFWFTLYYTCSYQPVTLFLSLFSLSSSFPPILSRDQTIINIVLWKMMRWLRGAGNEGDNTVRPERERENIQSKFKSCIKSYYFFKTIYQTLKARTQFFKTIYQTLKARTQFEHNWKIISSTTGQRLDQSTSLLVVYFPDLEKRL